MENEINKKKCQTNSNKNKLNVGSFNKVDDHPSARVLMNQILESNNNKNLNNLNANQYINYNINLSENNNNNGELLQKRENNDNLITINLNIPKN